MDQEIKKEFEDLTKVVKGGFDATDEHFGEIDERFEKIEAELEHVKNQMVTKDYLDEKLVEHHGNLVILMRKGDAKLLRLVEILKEKNVLNEEEVKELSSLEPFPKLAL